MSPRRRVGIPLWFWIVAALAQTVIATKLWLLWLDFEHMEASYPPEVRAAAHFSIPSGLIREAMTASAVALLPRGSQYGKLNHHDAARPAAARVARRAEVLEK